MSVSMSASTKTKALLPGRKARINRATIGDQIYGELCHSLSSGELAPGDRLSIRKVAAALGVSMMPVREAVTRLVVDSALEIMPNKAIRVPIMTSSTFRELTTVRLEIEGFATEHAVAKHSSEDLERIKLHEESFRQAAGGAQPKKLEALRANRDFHFAIYAASGFPTLVRIIEMLWLRVGPIINLDLEATVTRGAQTALSHHARLVRALETRDVAEARKALEGDLLGTANFVLEAGHLADS